MKKVIVVITLLFFAISCKEKVSELKDNDSLEGNWEITGNWYVYKGNAIDPLVADSVGTFQNEVKINFIGESNKVRFQHSNLTTFINLNENHLYDEIYKNRMPFNKDSILTFYLFNIQTYINNYEISDQDNEITLNCFLDDKNSDSLTINVDIINTEILNLPPTNPTLISFRGNGIRLK